MIVFSGVKMRIVLVVLFLLGHFCLLDASTGSHSLRYFYTGVSDPGPGFPEYYTVGYVDDKAIRWYDSVSQRTESRARWMTENVGPEYWESSTQNNKANQQTFKANVKIAMDRFNQSGGVHTVQLMYGCVREQDGSTRGFRQYAYDGHDFLNLDKERVVYVAAVPEAEITQQKWRELGEAERFKGYLEQTCIEWLKKYVKYGEKELDSKVQPSVKVLARRSEGRSTTLHCQVTGFYPREIVVKWVKNGKVTMQGTAAKDILPNHDGTYQTRESVQIDSEEATYSCQVDHSSLPEPLNVLWETKSSSPPYGIIFGAIAVLAVLVIVIAGLLGFYFYRKNLKGRKLGYSAASGKEDGSSTSSGVGPNPAI